MRPVAALRCALLCLQLVRKVEKLKEWLHCDTIRKPPMTEHILKICHVQASLKYHNVTPHA